MPMSFIMSKNVEHSSGKTPQGSSFPASRELSRFLPRREGPLVYKFHTSAISAHFFDQVQVFFFSFALLLRLDSKQTGNSRTYRHLD